jgi:hypothetical protein
MNQQAARVHGLPSFPQHAHHMNAIPNGNFDMRAMTGFGHLNGMQLPKIETSGLGLDLGGGLKTAPVPMVGDGYDFEKMFASASTINPAQLHFAGGPMGSASPFNQTFSPLAGGRGPEEDENFDWVGGLGDTLMASNEAAVDGSSPSAISTASQSGFSEVMVDGSNNPAQANGLWPNPIVVSTSQFAMDPVSAAVFPELLQPMSTISPKELHDQTMSDHVLMSNAPGMSNLSGTSGTQNMASFFQPSFSFGPDASSSTNSGSGNGRQSSVSSMYSDSITDATRQALLYSLSQSSGFGYASRTTYPSSNPGSPLSPGYGSKAAADPVSLPTTADLQRYVNAYIHYFHPHMPFLHIPTLTFDSPVFTSNMRANHSWREGIIGGGGSLILAMAAIGASYEFDHDVAKDLFESAKKMINIYLEERRKASQSMPNSAQQKTPLWLVQAMLLNLIYGHQCGDRVTVEIATTHCAALVSLAKAAELDKPDNDLGTEEARSYVLRNRSNDVDMDMIDPTMSPRAWRRSTPHESREEHAEWYRWKSAEERKRTFCSVFVLSSLLVTAYNHQPRILNSELHLDLPCEEDLWAADSARNWNALGGAASATANSASFAGAMTFLLTSSQRQQSEHSLSSYQAFGSTVPLDQVPESELKPSTFGCYVLINALHVYIWETRQRHQGRQWKAQETEQMHAQVEPALRAWQAAWHSNPHHNLERPNPYGPLPADSIPLLDLAYVRLFVNLGRSKEAFWSRDFEAMAHELGTGAEIIQHADSSRDSSQPPEMVEHVSRFQSPSGMEVVVDVQDSPNDSRGNPEQSSKRERHLRKAAFYAADSLSMADKLGVTFAEFTSRELPIQAAMCTFDCAQILAEWISTVQSRVGRYLGILGRDDIDFSDVSAAMLLEEEDVKLLNKVNEILGHADVKIAFDAAAQGTSPEHMMGPYADAKDAGYGPRLLQVTAYMLDKAAVWGSKSCWSLIGYTS